MGISKKKQMVKNFYLFVFMAIFLFSVTANAQINSINLSLDATGKYSDNIDYDRVNPTDDFYALISPSISYHRSSELSDFNMKALADIIRYQEKSDQDYENQEYSMGGSFSPSERTRFYGDIFFKDDITLEGELIDTGEVSTRQHRRQYIGKGGGSWRFSERTSIGIAYQYLKKEFESESYVDYDQHYINASFNRSINNGIDTISLIPAFYYTENDYSTVDNYSLSLGWKHTFSETFSMNISAGGRYTEQSYRNSGLQYDNSGWVAGVNVRRGFETGSFTLGYSRNLWTNVDGGQTEVDRITLEMNKWILSRLGVSFSGSYYLRNEPEQAADQGQTYYRVITSLDFRLTEKQLLIIGYQYDNVDNGNVAGDGTTEVNAVWVKLRLTYDKIF